ncbi:MAG TPA: saccharopine dehydrogenase NADP-binding domain-containing protein, partial [Anaerolineales bacterium]|nr:saccharopine dehydrogenase NADP-binding domain-containing protein [Anaerolineales bacterium]
MRIVILGGAGIIGKVIARDLIQDVDEVVIADLDLQAAQSTAAAIGGGSPARVDVTQQQELVTLLRGAGACVNSVNYYFNLPVMRACLEAEVPYLDLGGLFHTTRKQLELHPEFQRAGVTAVLGLGSCPGVANVQA